MKMCKFCEFDQKTNRGRDLYSEKYLTDEELNIDGADGYCFTYLEKIDGHFYLVDNQPDNEMYSRAIAKIGISNCPWCGRKLC